jgi:transcriptional regulator with XRE-family HTH domain
MAPTSYARVTFDTEQLALDMAVRGWEQKDLAAAAGVSLMTVSRFFRGETRTVKTLAKFARALGYSVRRYLTRSQHEASA